MSRLRVLHYTTWQTECGIAMYAEQLNRALAEQGVDSAVHPADVAALRHLSKAQVRARMRALCEEARQYDVLHIQHDYSFFANGPFLLRRAHDNFMYLLRLLAKARVPTAATFHVERSLSMNAPPEAAFAQVNDFHAWHAWSPWEKMDPAMKRTFDGAPAGVGAKYAWVGNKDVGEGRMTIEESSPSKIAIKLEFLKPFEATNTATFTFTKTPEGSKTTWAMDGNNNFFSKAMSLFMNMDKMIGPDF